MERTHCDFKWILLVGMVLPLFGCRHDPPFCRDGYCGCGDRTDCPMDCGDRDGCFMDCGSVNVCETWCDNDCRVSCEDATSCLHHCGADCRLDCHSIGSCRAVVGPGSVASCSNFGACEIECLGSCKVNCYGCTVICPVGESPVLCPSGNAYVCGDADCSLQ